MMDSELLELISFLNNELLWLYFIIIFIAFYAIISLLTWNIKKPLMFLGIPSIIVGFLLIALRFSVGLFLPHENLLVILNSAVKPLFTSGVICIVAGIAMIIIYRLLNKMQIKKQMTPKTDI